MRLFFSLSIVLFISCTNQDKNTDGLSFYSDGIIKVQIPENVYYNSFLNQISYKEDSIYLERLRNKTGDKGIDMINLTSLKYSQSTIFPEEGNQGVGRMSSFYRKSNDTLLFTNEKEILIVIDDSIGKRMRLFENEDYYPTMIRNKSKSFFYNKEYYFSKLAFSHPSRNDFFDINTLLRTNIGGESIPSDLSDTKFSTKYFDKCWSYFDADIYTTFNGENEVIFSFPIDEDIIVYSLKEEKILNKIPIKSRYDTKPLTSVNCGDIRSYDENEYAYQKFYYASIIYDKFREVYYRFNLLPIQDYNPKKRYDVFDRKFTITVLDNEFNIIGESAVFEKHKFIFYDWFILEDGFYLSSNNPKNETFNENELSYTIFKFKP